MRGLLCLLVLLAVTPAARAVEGIPGWSRVLDGVLKRAEADAARERSSAPAAPKTPAMHPAVAQFVRYYESAGAPAWSNSVRRLEPMRDAVERTFDEEGVPRELIWLGLVESGYRATARSPKNAVGVWQFIPETARRFGLAVHQDSDERTDTPKATRAGARYLRFLYETFGDWHLSLAAYNAGEARVQAAIRRAGTRDFWSLAERGYLPRETRAYVPAVLAAQVLGRGGAVPDLPAVRAAVLEAPFSLSP
jgi:membrane-bound lytic murein transglycosylase D